MCLIQRNRNRERKEQDEVLSLTLPRIPPAVTWQAIEPVTISLQFNPLLFSLITYDVFNMAKS